MKAMGAERMEERRSDGFAGGFTLIELMVALLVGSVLFAAIAQNYIASQRSYNLLEGLSLVQEDGRISMNIIGRYLRLAGHRQDPTVLRGTALPATVAPVSGAPFLAGQMVTGTDGANDTVSFRFQPRTQGTPPVAVPVQLDCTGAIVIAGATAVNTLYLLPNATTGTNDLICASNLPPPAGVVAPEALVEGVDNMQVLYGIDTDGDLTANAYMNAGSVTAAGVWGNVVSVRISLLLNTINPVTKSTTWSFALLDQPAVPYTDGRRRQVFTTTVNLRNMVNAVSNQGYMRQ